MPRTLSTLVRSLALAGVAACALTPVLAAPAPEPTVSLAIGSRDLGAALTEFARQSGRQILFAPDLARGKRAPELRGRYGVDRALAMLLAGSGLRYRTTGSGTFVVEGGGTEGAAAAPAVRARPLPDCGRGPAGRARRQRSRNRRDRHRRFGHAPPRCVVRGHHDQ